MIADQILKSAWIASALGAERLDLGLYCRGDAAVGARVAKILGKADPIYGLIKIVGIAAIVRATKFTMVAWIAAFGITLSWAVLCTQTFRRPLNERHYGRMVSFASKTAAVIAMSKMLARRWEKRGITTNTISRTVINTTMAGLVWADARALSPARRSRRGASAR